MPSQPCIAIAIPSYDAINGDTESCLAGLDVPRPYHNLRVRGRPVTDARNDIVARAFQINDQAKTNPEIAPITHILWIDDDMKFPRDALRRLLAHDLPIVGGLCHCRRQPYMPILIYENKKTDHVPFTYRYDYPAGLVQVDATGAAFLLVKMEVFEAIEARFPALGEGPFSHDGRGEDVAFCQRARECGFSTYVDTTLEIPHAAEVWIDSNTARRLRDAEFSPWIPSDAKPLPGVPQASIIIPTFDQKPALLDAAVRSALAQTVPVEVIVVDNGSTKCVWCGGPRMVCGDGCICGIPEGVKVVRIAKNSGAPWQAINVGIDHATADYVAILSSDDLFAPRKIERQLRAMKSVGALVSCHAYDVHAPGEPGSTVVPVMQWRTIEEQQALLAERCFVNMLTLLVHRDVIAKVGKFDESYLISSDWEWENRIAQHYLIHPIADALATRLESPTNGTATSAADPTLRERWIAEDARIRDTYRKGTRR